MKQGFIYLENLFFSCLILLPLAILCPGSFEVVPAQVHAVLFPVFPCLFGPLLWLLLAPVQEDCCSWTLSLCDQSFWIIRPHSSSVCVAVNKSCDLSFNFDELLLQRPPSPSRPAT